jgi:hypothetical protein
LLSILFYFSKEVDNLASRLLLTGRYEQAVEVCIKQGRYTEAILIANLFDKQLLAKTQQIYFKNNMNDFSKVFKHFIF